MDNGSFGAAGRACPILRRWSDQTYHSRALFGYRRCALILLSGQQACGRHAGVAR